MENITLRKKIQRSESENDLKDVSDNIDLNATLLDSTSLSQQSINNDDDIYTELKNELAILKQKLQSADNEIDNLNYENKHLKKKISEQNKQIDCLKKISQTYNFNCHQSDGHSSPTTISKRMLNIKMRYPRVSPLHTYKNITCLSQGNTPVSSRFTSFTKQDRQTTKKDFEINSHSNSIPDNTIIRKTILKEDDEIHTLQCESNKQDSSKRKYRIVILGDSRGRGLRRKLQELLGSSYIVTSFLKPNALFEDIVNSCKSEILTLTNDDCVILLGGCDDKNPEKLNTELNVFLKSLAHTNVIVSEIPVNRFLNEKTLNYQFKFTCKKFINTIYMDLNYSKIIPKLGNFVNHLARCTLKEILSINYKQNFKKYNLSLQIKNNTNKLYRDIGTQTLNTGSIKDSSTCTNNNIVDNINSDLANNTIRDINSDNSIISNNLFRV